MSSYNSIQKFEYHSLNENEPVSLKEYIEFKDDRTFQKYAVLKFQNRITQRLFKITFTVSSYGKDDNLIEKSVITYSSLKVNENETFVPNAKLKLNYDTTRIAVELNYAKFETCEYKDGEFTNVQYTFDEYLKTQQEDKELSKDEKVQPEKAKKIIKKQSKIEHKIADKTKYNGFYFNDITEANKTKKPLVFTIIFALVISIIAFVTTLTVSKSASWFTVGDFDLEMHNNTLSIKKYHGKDKDLYIPATIADMEVVEILPSAFEDNDYIQTITFDSYNLNTNEMVTEPLYIGERAFAFCDNITSVISNDRALRASTYSFAKCYNLMEFVAPYAVLYSDSFYDIRKINYIKVQNINTDTLNGIFNSIADYGSKEYTYNLSYIYLSSYYRKPNTFLEGNYISIYYFD